MNGWLLDALLVRLGLGLLRRLGFDSPSWIDLSYLLIGTLCALALAGDYRPALEHLLAIVRRDRKASTSYLQRRLQIGYNRVATLIEKMERAGIISEANAAGKRDILVDVIDED